MQTNSEGFFFPVIDESACINCGKCERVCPVLNANAKGTPIQSEAWAAIHKDSQILSHSSSGGVFSALAKVILSQGGCVFGAAFNNDCRSVQHIEIRDVSGLTSLQGSKYLQSDIADTYRQVAAELAAGKTVLFTGTPCQVAGLRGYIGRDEERLFLVDVICHGVPSGKAWEHYLDSVEKKYGSRADAVNFRDKKHGWNQFGMAIRMTDGNHQYQRFNDNPYMRMFLRNNCLRESCYHCIVKERKPVADMTIGDFWGVERLRLGMDSRSGVSLVLTHTEKGKALFEQAGAELEKKQVDASEAAVNNSALTHSVARPPERDGFYQDLSSLSWKEMEKKYAHEELNVLLRRKIVKPVLRMIRKAVKTLTAGK